MTRYSIAFRPFCLQSQNGIGIFKDLFTLFPYQTTPVKDTVSSNSQTHHCHIILDSDFFCFSLFFILFSKIQTNLLNYFGKILYCDVLPGKGSVNTFQHATVEEVVFSMWSVQRLYITSLFVAALR
jgi:hypothetical protein